MNTSPVAFSQPLSAGCTSGSPSQREVRLPSQPRGTALPSATPDGLDVARLAHDVNNLLAPALMVLDLVRPGVCNPNHCRLLDISKRSLLQATALMREAVAAASERAVLRTLINPRHIVEEVFAFARETFPATIRVELEIEEQPGFIAASAAELHRALVNLCVNARDAMPAGGTLTLRLTGAASPAAGIADCSDATAHGILIEVCDTGSGIPNSLREKIFDPFFTTKAPGKGTGLGLASVKGFVESHDGCLSLQTEVGTGSAFRIFLPAV